MRNLLRRRARPLLLHNEIVTKEDYCELLDSYFRSEAEHFSENTLIQQDGAPPQTNLAAISLLADIFGQNWIGKYRPSNWPARSPDLTPPDSFLWGYVKDQLLKAAIQNLSQLKRIITRARSSVTHEVIIKVREDLENRLDAIIRENGGHIEHL